MRKTESERLKWKPSQSKDKQYVCVIDGNTIAVERSPDGLSTKVTITRRDGFETSITNSDLNRLYDIVSESSDDEVKKIADWLEEI